LHDIVKTFAEIHSVLLGHVEILLGPSFGSWRRRAQLAPKVILRHELHDFGLLISMTAADGVSASWRLDFVTLMAHSQTQISSLSDC